jgi:hypothetical protein
MVPIQKGSIVSLPLKDSIFFISFGYTQTQRTAFQVKEIENGGWEERQNTLLFPILLVWLQALVLKSRVLFFPK